MKKILALVMALVFVFTTAVVFAEKPAAKPAEPAKKAEATKEKVKQISGEITAIDTAGKTITVKSKKQELTIGVTDEQIKDLKAGDKVVVKYTEKDGKLTAKSVKKTGKTAEKKEAPKKETPKKKKAVEGC